MSERTLTEAQNGGHLRVRVGDVVVIRLSEGGGGHRWSIVSPASPHLAVEEHRFAAGQGVGSGGHAEWRLKASSAGVATVELRKRRPWESADASIESFTARLEIAE